MSFAQCMMIIGTVGLFTSTDCFTTPRIQFSRPRHEDCGARCYNDELFYAEKCILIIYVNLGSKYKDVLASCTIKNKSSQAETKLFEFNPQSICENYNSTYDYDCEKIADNDYIIKIYLKNQSKFVGAQIKCILKQNEANKEYNMDEQILPAQFGTVTINGKVYNPENCDAILHREDLNLQFNCGNNNKDCLINITSNNTQTNATTNNSSLFEHTFNYQQEVVEVYIRYDICDKRIYNSTCRINAGSFKAKEGYPTNRKKGDSLAWIAGVVVGVASVILVLCSWAFRYRCKIKRCFLGTVLYASERKRASYYESMEMTAFLADTNTIHGQSNSDLQEVNEIPSATTDNGPNNSDLQDENEPPSTMTVDPFNSRDKQVPPSLDIKIDIEGKPGDMPKTTVDIEDSTEDISSTNENEDLLSNLKFHYNNDLSRSGATNRIRQAKDDDLSRDNKFDKTIDPSQVPIPGSSTEMLRLKKIECQVRIPQHSTVEEVEIKYSDNPETSDLKTINLKGTDKNIKVSEDVLLLTDVLVSPETEHIREKKVLNVEVTDGSVDVQSLHALGRQT